MCPVPHRRKRRRPQTRYVISLIMFLFWSDFVFAWSTGATIIGFCSWIWLEMTASCWFFLSPDRQGPIWMGFSEGNLGPLQGTPTLQLTRTWLWYGKKILCMITCLILRRYISITSLFFCIFVEPVFLEISILCNKLDQIDIVRFCGEDRFLYFHWRLMI